MPEKRTEGEAMNGMLGVVLVVAAVAALIVKRFVGEPLNGRDLAIPPLVLTGMGIYTLSKVHPLTGMDIGWNVGLGVVGVIFGLLRGSTIQLFEKGGVLWQRYTGRTFLVWIGTLAASLALGFLATRLGLHHNARPMTLSIGIGLVGEMVPVGLRALGSGIPFAPERR